MNPKPPKPNKGKFARIFEGNSQIQRTLSREFPDVISKLYGPTAVHDDTSYMYLQIFVVPKDLRNNGLGTRYMKRLIDLSKKEGVDIFLTPDASYQPKNGMNLGQITDWYKSLGFKKKDKTDLRNQATYIYTSKK